MAGGAEGDGRAAVWVAAAAGWAAGAMYGCSVALTISYVNHLFDGDAFDWLSFICGSSYTAIDTLAHS